ncbi:glycoside hydrolase family 88 protein [Bacillus carboniphilus]|uniref:Glycoside hydrolase family 88 protein n=1 Tax=Bacillus carboniphilus TaxID=86663 RepID=A0ABY9JVH2_9BACI|nr:glycoside hydrolase family 88 protein [Bacillus carboniphilus]WLR42794.1 glycoside hydrolase family 88 protein [Bacillus carboniphilus]
MLRSLKWVNDTPKVTITDNNRLIILDILKKNYSSHTIQHWQHGALLLGLGEYIKIHGNKEQKINKKVEKFLTKSFSSTGEWRDKPENIDSAILAYAIMKFPGIDMDKYKPAWDYICKLIDNHVGEEGTVKYRNVMEQYRYVDTIGFICPFLIFYGNKYDKPYYIELAIKQIVEFENNGFSKKSNLPFHAYNINGSLPLGLNGWGRGVAWYLLGLMDSWLELPKHHPQKEKLQSLLKSIAKAIMNYQQPNGSWNWSMTRDETRSDSSTTAVCSWFLARVYQLIEEDRKMLASSEKAIQFLQTVTRRNGSVDFSQGDTKDIGVYSINFGVLPFTQGYCLRAMYCKDHILDGKRVFNDNKTNIS